MIVLWIVIRINLYAGRYYDPVIGRFYSNDPIGWNPVHSFGRYTYANNNPYKYVDPDGQLGMLVTSFVGGLIGGGLELGKQLYAGGDIDLGKVGVEAGKGALVGLGVGAVGGYMAALSEGVVTSTVAKAGTELLGKTTGAMRRSLTGDLVDNALGGDISGSEQTTNMVGNMIAPGSGDIASAAVKAMVKSEVVSAGTREVSATVTSEVVKDKLNEN